MHNPNRHFLVVSNMRCGSTLLQFMLGELSDVGVDYEVKWNPSYPAHDIHLVIDRSTVSMRLLLDAHMPEHAITGSKLTFDPVALSCEDYAHIASMIEPDIRIVHLKRCYHDILLSARRGFLHIPTQQADSSGSKAYRILQSRADMQSVISRSYIGNDRRGLLKEEIALLRILLRNDLAALRLRRNHPYRLVRYPRITSRFGEICAFVGSREQPDKIKAIQSSPPLRKLPPIQTESRLIEHRAVSALFDAAFWLAYAASVLYPRSHQLRQPPAME